MNQKELRIGNKVDLYGTIASVVCSDFTKWSDGKGEINAFQPIPLTEEILLKCGFKRSADVPTAFLYGNNLCISTEENAFRFIKGNAVCQIVLREIEYLHQLQNLYFALTGEELPVNL